MTVKLHTIRTLLIIDFMDMINTGNLSKIVIEGEPSKEELQAAFASIQNDYFTILEDGNYKLYLAQTGRIEDKKAKIIRVSLTVNRLIDLSSVNCTSPVLLADLQKDGYTVKFDPNNIKKYVSDLELIYSRLKKDKIQLEEMINEIADVKNTKTGSIDSQFGEMITAIASVLNIRINPATDVLWTYAYARRSLMQQLKRLKNVRRA